MKIKDLDPKTSLCGVKVKTPEGRIGLWKSQWPKGVWLKNDDGTGRVFPIFVEQLTDCMDWEIVEDKSTPTNLS